MHRRLVRSPFLMVRQIAARGQICRECRFNLAGLDLESFDAKCPECGSEIHHEAARSPILRIPNWDGAQGRFPTGMEPRAEQFLLQLTEPLIEVVGSRE